jgi:hypothetical protein
MVFLYPARQQQEEWEDKCQVEVEEANLMVLVVPEVKAEWEVAGSEVEVEVVEVHLRQTQDKEVLEELELLRVVTEVLEQVVQQLMVEMEVQVVPLMRVVEEEVESQQ